MLKLLVSDLDGTLISFGGMFGSSWEAVARICGNYEEYKRYFAEYYHQQEKAVEWTRVAARTFKGKRIAEIHHALPNLPYNRGAEAYFRKFKREHPQIETGILSSGLDIVAKRVRKELCMGFVECTELEVREGILTGETLKIIPQWDKSIILREIIKKRGLSREQVVYIGDSDNDKECFDLAGVRVLFQGGNHSYRPTTIANCVDCTIDDFNKLEQILQV